MTYLKIVLFLIISIFNVGFLLPYLVSDASNVSVVLGVLDIVAFLPFIFYYGLWIKRGLSV